MQNTTDEPLVVNDNRPQLFPKVVFIFSAVFYFMNPKAYYNNSNPLNVMNIIIFGMFFILFFASFLINFISHKKIHEYTSVINEMISVFIMTIIVFAFVYVSQFKYFMLIIIALLIFGIIRDLIPYSTNKSTLIVGDDGFSLPALKVYREEIFWHEIKDIFIDSKGNRIFIIPKNMHQVRNDFNILNLLFNGGRRYIDIDFSGKYYAQDILLSMYEKWQASIEKHK